MRTHSESDTHHQAPPPPWSHSHLVVSWGAGVYFEKYVKGKQGQTLWIRNLQLSIYGVPLAMVYCFFRDGR